MRPSSSRSERAGEDLFAPLFSRGEAAAEVSDSALLQAMLDTEAALARALSRAGLVSDEAARAVTAAARADRYDIGDIGAASVSAGNPVPALVKAIVGAVPPEAASAVHYGATSQDILDTAFMLIAKRAITAASKDVRSAMNDCARLCEEHRKTVMIGRTLLTPAAPVTFGLKAALWLDALGKAEDRLSVTASSLPIQFGGATGTLAVLDGRGVEVSALLAEELGLAEPRTPWHTLRLPVVELAGSLAGVAVVFGKMARDVSLLAQPEIGEVRLPAESGGSSTLPQKTNPVGAVAVLGCTRRVPGLVATLLAAAEQEHERAAGGWHAEWEALRDLLRLVGSASAWGRELVAGISVVVDRMRANLEGTGGLLLAERLVSSIAPAVGRLEAHETVRRVALRAREEGRDFVDALFDDETCRDAFARCRLDRNAVARLLDPSTYLGSTDVFIDRVLAAHGTGSKE